mmetsp:Transcript_15496/g.35940  ORF Transcript_15496/g.35940 Transcript_15496/m.35940 type:complete len:122 (-) Transcript_15496:18-383(-)
MSLKMPLGVSNRAFAASSTWNCEIKHAGHYSLCCCILHNFIQLHEGPTGNTRALQRRSPAPGKRQRAERAQAIDDEIQANLGRSDDARAPVYGRLLPTSRAVATALDDVDAGKKLLGRNPN